MSREFERALIQRLDRVVELLAEQARERKADV